MSADNNKLAQFTSTIIQDATQLSERLLAEVEETRARILAQARQEAEAELARYVQAEKDKITYEAGMAISKKVLDNKKQLARCREKIAAAVLEETRQKLEDFSHNPAYPAYLERQLNKALEAMPPDAGKLVARVRAEDLPLMKRLAERSAGGRVSAVEQADIRLGGLILHSPDKRMSADLSIDAAYAELDGHVSEYIGLNLGSGEAGL